MIDSIYSSLSSIPFDTLVWVILGSFAAITALVLILCFAVPKLKSAGKRPYLCLVNAYTALILATFLIDEPLGKAALAAVLFWCFGYLLYGVICFISKPEKREESIPPQITYLPSASQVSLPHSQRDIPTAKSSVRLEHAISVTERLLQKNLGKSDRQEVEKLKSTLAVLQLKGELSPAESDILNDNFNALLKLMAKYNI